MFYSQKKANGAPNGLYSEIDWDRYVSKSLRMLIIHNVFIVPMNVIFHLFDNRTLLMWMMRVSALNLENKGEISFQSMFAY